MRLRQGISFIFLLAQPAIFSGCSPSTASDPSSQPGASEILNPARTKSAILLLEQQVLGYDDEPARLLLKQLKHGDPEILEQKKGHLKICEALLLGRAGQYAKAQALIDSESSPPEFESVVLLEKLAWASAQGHEKEELQALQRQAEINSPIWKKHELRFAAEWLYRSSRYQLDAPQEAFREELLQLLKTENSDPGQELERLAMLGRIVSLDDKSEANRLYNLAEQGGLESDDLLLWRAQLYIESWQPDPARYILLDLLRRKPSHQPALALQARLLRESYFNMKAARSTAEFMLSINPKSVDALFELASLALNYEEYDDAEKLIEQGLLLNPKSAEFIALAATLAFLDEDLPNLEKHRARFQAIYRSENRLIDILARHAEWEHRYQLLVPLLEEIVDREGPSANISTYLGINLLRTGHPSQGVLALRDAFERSPHNVRVANILNLYEGPIRERYLRKTEQNIEVLTTKDDQPLIAEVLLPLILEAKKTLSESYGLELSETTYLELYPKRDEFAVRVNGLPELGLEGVCFGNTAVILAPHQAHSNIAATIWHEFSHVFHLKLSNSRVPRWFSEGLADYEMGKREASWGRHNSQDLAALLRRGELPNFDELSRQFVDAEDLESLGLAYELSDAIVDWIHLRLGSGGIRQLLIAWKDGGDSGEVLAEALGLSKDQLRPSFETYLRKKLAFTLEQFAPWTPSDLERLEKESKAKSSEGEQDGLSEKRTRLAISRFYAGDRKVALTLLQSLAKENNTHPQALFALAQIEQQAGNPREALRHIAALLEQEDGAAIQALLITVADALKSEELSLSARIALAELDPENGANLTVLAAHQEQLAPELKDKILKAFADSGVVPPLARVLYLKQLVEAYPKTASELAAVNADALSANLKQQAERAQLGALFRSDAHLWAAKAYHLLGLQEEASSAERAAMAVSGEFKLKSADTQAYLNWVQINRPKSYSSAHRNFGLL